MPIYYDEPVASGKTFVVTNENSSGYNRLAATIVNTYLDSPVTALHIISVLDRGRNNLQSLHLSMHDRHSQSLGHFDPSRELLESIANSGMKRGSSTYFGYASDDPHYQLLTRAEVQQPSFAANVERETNRPLRIEEVREFLDRLAARPGGLMPETRKLTGEILDQIVKPELLMAHVYNQRSIFRVISNPDLPTRIIPPPRNMSQRGPFRRLGRAALQAVLGA